MQICQCVLQKRSLHGGRESWKMFFTGIPQDILKLERTVDEMRPNKQKTPTYSYLF